MMITDRAYFSLHIENIWKYVDLNHRYIDLRTGEKYKNVINWLDSNLTRDYFWQIDLEGEAIENLELTDRIFKLITADRLWFQNSLDLKLFIMTWR